MPVAILAGGLATRLHPLTINLPKALIPFGGKPFIEYQLELLRANGIEHVVICAGYRGAMIRDSIGTGQKSGLYIEYSFDEPALLGTGGALRKALPLLGHEFFVLYGDAYVLCDFKSVLTVWESSITDLALMTVAPNKNNRHTSNVEFHSGAIMNYSKLHLTPQMQHFDYGLSIISDLALDVYPDTAYPGTDHLDLGNIFDHLRCCYQLAALEVLEPVYEIGSFRGMDEFREYCQGLG